MFFLVKKKYYIIILKLHEFDLLILYFTLGKNVVDIGFLFFFLQNIIHKGKKEDF